VTGRPAAFFVRVWAWVARVPRGRVVTYGHVARALGQPRAARAVGWAMRALSGEQADRVPWHRVVGAGGRISPRAGPGPELQHLLLRREGVRFVAGRVDLARHELPGPPATRRRARPPAKAKLARGNPVRARRIVRSG
jgi:methylated-DNA-protein-cysteine methyltransferase-like protein